ncbi:MAG: chemotaxis protein CheC [Dehalococcoidia bacterium]|nr:MAG: chemotaxis protein CheC [Dehalococcoidia bacterium]
MTNVAAILRERELATLQRLVDAAMAQAATSLGEMVGLPVTIETPAIARVALGQVAELVGGPEVEAVAVYLLMTGDLAGHLLLVLRVEAAYRMVAFLLGEPAEAVTVLDPVGASALAELGNVTVGAFLNRLADSLEIRLLTTPPAQAIDMAGSLLDGVLAQVSHGASEALVFHTHFTIAGEQVEGLLLVMPEAASLTTLLELAARR